MIDETEYQKYIALVCSKRMQEAADAYYTDDIEVVENGVLYRGKQTLLDLRAATHECMNEGIEVLHFFKGEDGFATEVKYSWEATRDISSKDFEGTEFGGVFEHFLPLKKGDVGTTHCVFRYHTRGDRFSAVRVFTTFDKEK